MGVTLAGASFVTETQRDGKKAVEMDFHACMRGPIDNELGRTTERGREGESESLLKIDYEEHMLSPLAFTHLASLSHSLSNDARFFLPVFRVLSIHRGEKNRRGQASLWVA